MLKRYHLKYIAAFSVILLLCFIIFFRPNVKIVHDKRILMHTTVQIDVLGKNRQSLQPAINKAFSEIKKIDNMMNFYDNNSQLSELNKQAKKYPYKVTGELYYLVDKCIKFGKITRGGFDVTATSLDETAGYRKITLNPDKKTVYFEDPHTKIDLSAAAKGYAVDKAIESLQKTGIQDALINAGGDIRVIGRYKNKKWSIGIRNPIRTDRIILTIKLTDEAIATSGNYLRQHIINTSKKKEDMKVLSSTVIAGDCVTADILATSLYVMGKKGINLINKMDGIEGVLIVKDGKKLRFVESKNFKKYYK